MIFCTSEEGELVAIQLITVTAPGKPDWPVTIASGRTAENVAETASVLTVPKGLGITPD